MSGEIIAPSPPESAVHWPRRRRWHATRDYAREALRIADRTSLLEPELPHFEEIARLVALRLEALGHRARDFPTLCTLVRPDTLGQVAILVGQGKLADVPLSRTLLAAGVRVFRQIDEVCHRTWEQRA